MTRSTTWLVIGDGPSAPQGALGFHHRADHVITTNSAILLVAALFFTAPDFHYVQDATAAQRMAPFVAAAAERGTRIVAPRNEDYWYSKRCVSRDIELDTLELIDETQYRAGDYRAVGTSGMMAMQYALNRGARTLLLAGFDGYRSGRDGLVVDTWDGRTGSRNGQRHNEKAASLFRAIAHAHPQVAIEFSAEPIYADQLAGCSNVRWTQAVAA